MSGMIRKQLFITAEQNRKLKERAAATGMSEAELIRAGIDLQLDGKAERTDWRGVAERLSGAWAERDSLEEEMSEIRQSWNRRDQVMGPKKRRP